MELCSDNLKNILENKHKAFGRERNNQMTELEYYISCKIFIELLEAINYLHEHTPPIFHRDIKPANILFTEKGTGIFFKLCDFGLAKLYEGTSNTRGMGTHKYMAPEVWDGKYDMKADVYSLGVVLHELFDLDNNSDRSDNLKEYFNIIEELMEDMSRKIFKKRPNCKDIIDGQNKWCLSDKPSNDFILNDLPECLSLNTYIKYHLDSASSDQQTNEHDDNESERSAKRLKLVE